VLFNTRDPEIHNRKWKLINAAFSPRHISDFEKYMDPHITALVKTFRIFALASESFDFQPWGKEACLFNVYR
jgi:benzoate 4-monooxygenase